MFAQKKQAPAETEEQLVRVQTIPNDFYGGVNPVVKFKRVEKEVVLQPKLSPTEKGLLDKATAVGGSEALHPVNLVSNRKYLLIGGAALFVLFIAGASWYYIRQAYPNKPVTPAPVPITNNPVETVPVVAETSTETSVVTPEPTSTVPQFSAEAPIEFPSKLLVESVDTDQDGLTDVAEEVFRTDPNIPDTDNDSYNDGLEVYNLYNPNGIAPVRLIDSGYVKDFVNPTFGYELYYPADWAAGNVDGSYRDMLFSTLGGENIEVRVFDHDPALSFADWFGQWAPDQNYGDLTTFGGYFKDQGMARSDHLVYYFYDANHAYVIVYHTTDSMTANYKSIITMIARSMRLPATEPTPTEATTTEATTTAL
ncbi:MAG: hypothetical protein WC526_01725 [Patescibacteria group bacterium]